MRLTHLVATAAFAALLAGCTNETLDTFDKAEVDIRSVKNKTTYELSGRIVSNMQAANMPKSSPIMIRIFKEEGALEIWKADATNRFAKLREYKICAWSGKLGPKVKEGDRQAPEGFYPISPGQMNPNSSYYLAINTGFPNRYDQANGRRGTNLMIHGACSSSGCYSMTDEQMQEIFALARDAYKGGQQSIQLQALPFRMTAENMARHKNSPNIEFWKMLKTGYDQFEITKRPPEVNICEKKYVFNQQTDGKFSPGGQCPAMSTPSTMQVALANYNKKYDDEYTKALKKYEGMVWYEPSEGERKAIVAKDRVGKELAYAPTGRSIDAGKLMKAEDLAKLEARRAELAEAKKAIELQTAELEKSTRGGKSIPVPAQNPLPRPVEQAAVEQSGTAAKGGFWSLFAKNGAQAQRLEPATPSELSPTGQNAAGAVAQTPENAAKTKAAATERAAVKPSDAAAQDAAALQQTPVEQAAPAKKGFWGSLFSKSETSQTVTAVATAPVNPAAEQQNAEQKPVAKTMQQQPQATAKAKTETAVKPAAAGQDTAATESAPAEQVVAEQPKKRPFWKIWGN